MHYTTQCNRFMLGAGKALRAELAKKTGRSSVPNIWIGERKLLPPPPPLLLALLRLLLLPPLPLIGRCARLGLPTILPRSLPWLMMPGGTLIAGYICSVASCSALIALLSASHAAGKNVGGCNDGPGVATLQVRPHQQVRAGALHADCATYAPLLLVSAYSDLYSFCSLFYTRPQDKGELVPMLKAAGAL